MSRSPSSAARLALAWRWQLLVFLAAALAIFSRRPDAFLNPQFWAEDGGVWYSQAYNLGWLHALTLPEGGYFNTLPRLVASLALALPLAYAPLFMNSVGLCFQALPVVVLLSSRCAGWGPLWVRAFYAAVYLALPNSWEINVNITDAHFHLALVCFLIAIATPPPNLAWKVFDVTVLLLVGLTGPWEIVLCPLVLLWWWLRRYPWSLVVLTITAACAALQGFVLLSYSGAGQRDTPHLGATFMRFFRLLAGNVFSGALIGQNALGIAGSIPTVLLISLCGLCVLLYAFRQAPLEQRLFTVFCFALFAASLSHPIIKGTTSQWVMLLNDQGARYWFFPMLASLWALVWCVTRAPSLWVRRATAVLLLLLAVGILRDWHYKPYEDRNFPYYARQFALAPPGSHIEIPINPELWKVRLHKK